MPIANRDLDLSERRVFLNQEYVAANLVTGATNVLGQILYPCSLDFAQYAAFGLSNSPNVQIIVNRFIIGTGFTAFNLGSTNAIVAFGTSGVPSYGLSLPSIGSTLTSLQTNDILMMQVGGTNAAMTGMTVSLVLRPIQDIVKYCNQI